MTLIRTRRVEKKIMLYMEGAGTYIGEGQYSRLEAASGRP